MSIEERDQLVFFLERYVRGISKTVFEENHSQEQPAPNLLSADPEVRRIRGAIQQIQAKEFISVKESVKEAAVLLNCSESHIHNLVDRVRRGLSKNPIPYREIRETAIFLGIGLLVVRKDS